MYTLYVFIWKVALNVLLTWKTWAQEGFFKIVVHGHTCRTSKFWLLLYVFLLPSTTHQWYNHKKKKKKKNYFTQIGCFLRLFAQNTPNLFVNWVPFSVMKTPWLLYQNLRNSTPKGRYIYVYHVNVRTPSGALRDAA